MDSSKGKENVLSQIPTGRNNALVAESDVLAAVQAIHETFRAHEQRWEEKEAGAAAASAEEENRPSLALAGKDPSQHAEKQNQPPGGPRASAKFRELNKAMLEDRAKRLVESVYRVSQVIPDDLYNSFVKEYCDEYDLSDGDDSDEDGDDAEGDEDEEEDEFSPHELVDHVAQQKVDELRRQVLDRAKQVQLKRKDVIERATRIAREATLQSTPAANSAQGAPSTSARWGDVDPEKAKGQVAAMRESMKGLQLQLLTSEKKLEKQLDQLKSTVAVIEKHQLQGGRNPTQKVDEIMRTSFGAPRDALQDDDDGTPALDPAERLDEFLRR